MNNYDDLLNNVPISKEEYSAKKQAEREAVYELSDVTAMVVAGDGGHFQQYLDVQAGFDRYSTVNTLLILAQKPEATRLGDFDYWKSKGAFVRQGETGISILEPGKEYERRDGSGMAIGYNIKKVFDISQVDPRKAERTPPPSYTDRQLVSALISKAPVKITGVDATLGGLGAITNPETGEIGVCKGMGLADTFSSVARELAAAELSTGPDTQVEPQFSAYCASYLLCKKYGVDTQGFDFTDVSAVFGGMDAQAVKGELSQIRDAADDISGRMAKQLDAVQKAARNQEAR